MKRQLTQQETLIAQTSWGVLLVAPLKDIHPLYPVNNPAYLESVKSSIQKQGLINPIVVMPVFISDWKLLHKINPDLLPPPEGPDDKVVLQIRCGNNRYYAAKELGWKYIDTKRVYTQDECNSVCKEMRKTCF